MNAKKCKELRRKIKEIMKKNGKNEKDFDFYYKQAKKMARIGLVMFMFLCTFNAYADLVTIPFDCYPKEIQKGFEERGYKLDLDSSDRTKTSWGFLINKGTKFEIYTYKPISVEELEMIRDITWEKTNGKN